MRTLCQNDLYFLLRYVLNHPPNIADPWYFARCREFQAAPDEHIDLWARFHAKSTIITYAGTIWEIIKNPEVTVGIFSFNKREAKKFLKQIQRELEDNAALKGLFPEIFWVEPRKNARQWSEDEGIIVQRATNPKEPTVGAWGLTDGQPTGSHFALCVYDDAVTRDSVRTPESIQNVRESWELSLALGFDGSRRRYIGTRYHANDLYRTIIDRKAATPRLYPATIDGTPTGKPVFLSAKELETQRQNMGPYTFAAQMLLNPLADDTQGFKREWLRFYGDSLKAEKFNKYVIVDPASEKKATSDYTAIAVIGLGPDENYYLLELVRDRLNLTERADRVLALHQKWKPIRVGYERYGMQADIEYLKERQERENYRFDVRELGGRMPKNDRIRRLVPLFETGRFYLPEETSRSAWCVDYEGRRFNVVSALINDEFCDFPIATHDDMLGS
jgi:phage terminase large subunit-like protein